MALVYTHTHMQHTKTTTQQTHSITHFSRASSGKNRQMSVATAPGFTANARTRAPPACWFGGCGGKGRVAWVGYVCMGGMVVAVHWACLHPTTHPHTYIHTHGPHNNPIFQQNRRRTLARRLISWASSSCASCVFLWCTQACVNDGVRRDQQAPFHACEINTLQMPPSTHDIHACNMYTETHKPTLESG